MTIQYIKEEANMRGRPWLNSSVYETFCTNNNIDISRAVFLYGGNFTHSPTSSEINASPDRYTSMFEWQNKNCSTLGGIMTVADKLVSLGRRVHNLPMEFSFGFDSPAAVKVVVENAIANLYEAFGAGYTLVLPVRTPLSYQANNQQVFKNSLGALPFTGEWEPIFWNTVSGPLKGQEWLPDYYITEFDKFTHFMRLSPKDRKKLIDADKTCLFHQAFEKGKKRLIAQTASASQQVESKEDDNHEESVVGAPMTAFKMEDNPVLPKIAKKTNTQLRYLEIDPEKPINTVADYENSLKTLGIKPKNKPVFIFPGNTNAINTSAATLYSIKGDKAGLASVAKMIGEEEFATLSVPMTGISDRWEDNDREKALITKAIAELYRAVGHGCTLVLPVRNVNFVEGTTVFNDEVLPLNIDGPPLFLEPAFGGGNQKNLNPALAKYYLKAFTDLYNFVSKNYDEKHHSNERREIDPVFWDAFEAGRLMDPNNPWLASTPKRPAPIVEKTPEPAVVKPPKKASAPSVVLLTSYMHQRGGDLIAAISLMKSMLAKDSEIKFEWIIKRDISSHEKNLEQFKEKELGVLSSSVNLTILDSSDYKQCLITKGQVIDKDTRGIISDQNLTVLSNNNWGLAPTWHGWKDVHKQLSSDPLKDKFASANAILVVSNPHRITKADHNLLHQYGSKIYIIPEYDLIHSENKVYRSGDVRVSTGFNGQGVYIDEVVKFQGGFEYADITDKNFIEHLYEEKAAYKMSTDLFYGYFFENETFTVPGCAVKIESFIQNAIMLSIDRNEKNKIDIVIPGFIDSTTLKNCYKQALITLPPSYQAKINTAEYHAKNALNHFETNILDKNNGNVVIRLINPKRIQRVTVQALLNEADPFMGLTGDASLIEGLMKGKIVCYQQMVWKASFFQGFIKFLGEKFPKESPLFQFYALQGWQRANSSQYCWEKMRVLYTNNKEQMLAEAKLLAQYIEEDRNLNKTFIPDLISQIRSTMPKSSIKHEEVKQPEKIPALPKAPKPERDIEPVLVPGTHKKFFEQDLKDKPGFEPNFGGLNNTTPNKGLAAEYNNDNPLFRAFQRGQASLKDPIIKPTPTPTKAPEAKQEPPVFTPLRNSLPSVVPNKVLAKKIQFPASYKRIYSKGHDPLSCARALLIDYTKNNSRIKRVAFFHWDRHHVSKVNEIVNDASIKTIADLMRELDGIRLHNPKGSLARRIAFIQQQNPNVALSDCSDYKNKK